MTRAPANLAASVRARLLNISRQMGEDFTLTLTRYTTERFLYRLSVSQHADKFLLKGGRALRRLDQATLSFNPRHRSLGVGRKLGRSATRYFRGSLYGGGDRRRTEL